MELGFDCATLQSGYAFGRTAETIAEIGEATPKAVEDSAGEARKYGLGMEFELDLGQSNFYERYYKYVHTGYATGCMDGHMMMLYQSVSGIYGCANATQGSSQRQVYDMTYKYIKGTFTSYKPEIAPGQYIVAKLGSRNTGKLLVTDADNAPSTLQAVDVSIPEGLPFTIKGSGNYLLNAASSPVEAGCYEVTFSVSDGYNVSEPMTVKVLLYDPEEPGIELELKEALTAYTRLDTSATTVTIPAGAATARELENGWYYVSAVADGKTVEGFAEAAAIGLGDSDDGFPGWAIGVIAGGAALLAAAAGAIAVFVNKGKNKSAKKADNGE